MTSYYRILRLNHGRAPTVQHATLKEAETEALRLAGQHPGETFEILQVLGIARTTGPAIFWNDWVEPPIQATSLAPKPEAPTRYPTTPLPEGFDQWECRGFGWSAGHAVFTTGYDGYDPHWDERSTTGNTAADPALEYWEAVKDAPGYRRLEAGERMQEGDEFLVVGSNNQWLKRQRNLGQPWYPELYAATRRPTSNTPKP